MRDVKAPAGERYPRPLRVLHWLLALLLAAQVVLGFAAERWTAEATSARLFPLHFQLGVLIAALAALRLVLRLALPVPGEARGAPAWSRPVRSATHGLLYLLMFALPVSGHVIWVWMGADRSLFGSAWEVPAFFVPPADDESGRAMAWYVHVYGAWCLIALVSLHAAAAAWHQWVRRDRLIVRRMGFGAD
jgi:cytochrome b561